MTRRTPGGATEGIRAGRVGVTGRGSRCPWFVALALALVASCAPAPAPVPVATPRPPARPGEEPPVPVSTSPSATFDLRREPVLDVGLALDLDVVELSAGSKALIEDPAGRRRRCLGVVRIELAAGGARVVNRRPGAASGEEGTLGPLDTLWVGDPDSPSDSLVHWRGKTWRGRLKVFLGPRGKLTVADRLPLETYLIGVVPGEIGALDPGLLEAGRAQAIAARSYTLFYRGRRAAEGFDLYGSVEDQVYGPADSERPLATRCVESTRGILALSEGFPIRANYYSTCGGITADVWEAWPAGGLPYLVSHLDRDDAGEDGARGGEGGASRAPLSTADFCAASPQYRWREQWGADEFMANLARYAPAQGVALPRGGPGRLLDVYADRRSRSGRVWRLTVSTTTGAIVIPAYSIRQVLRRGGNGASILRSNLFKIDVRRDPASRSAIAVVASGAGSGHGVGLCQTGALGMARAGKDAREILEHYYRGAEVRPLY